MKIEKETGNLDALIQKYMDIEEEIKNSAKEDLGPFIREKLSYIFDADPTIGSVRWRQYTPYFNDGEPCVFRVWFEDEFLSSDFPEDAGDYEDGYMSVWYLKYIIENYADQPNYNYLTDDSDRWLKVAQQISSNVEERKSFLAFLNAIAIHAFGDHQEVVVYRDGSVSATYYEHD